MNMNGRKSIVGYDAKLSTSCYIVRKLPPGGTYWQQTRRQVPEMAV